jgi:hypothetical protein
MTDQELALLEKLIETNKGLIEAMTSIAESQYLIAQALMPMQIVGLVAEDEGPQTLQ